MRRTPILATLVFLALARAAAAIPPVAQDDAGLAAGGYDVVAYFTDGVPTRGLAEHELAWNGATWRFASAAHRDLFAAAPETYAPQYGGYCAWAVAHGYTAPTDPLAWRIVEGRLFLNYNLAVREKWSTDVPRYVADADRNWPGLRAAE